MIKLSFLLDEEREMLNQIILNAKRPRNPPTHFNFLENFYVPILPFECVELEIASIDNTMWRIPSINHPPPIPIDMWALWSGLTFFDLEGCQQCAIDGVYLSKLHVIGTTWAMSSFSTPCSGKYKCGEPSDVQVKIHGLPTYCSRHENHKYMLCNYHCTYFRCQFLAS